MRRNNIIGVLVSIKHAGLAAVGHAGEGLGSGIIMEVTARFVLQIETIDFACTIHNRLESPSVAIAFQLLRGGGNGLDVLAVVIKHNAAAARKLQVVVI
uniref:hypothetical protein n=1 Tax=Leyella stercorea TaxID=363265 RepID=UPI003FD85A27